MTKLLFLVSALFILYVYVGYPLLIYIWARLFPKRIMKAEDPSHSLVSVLISAYNEDERIAARLENLLAQDYPSGLLEIVVVSDGSSDRTEEIVRSYTEKDRTAAEGGAPRVKLVSFPENRGKPAALNAGFGQCRGEYIVFTDARQQFEPDAVRELIGNFSDPGVGAVSGELLFHENSDTSIKAEMGLYWNMEKWIRKTESRIHSVAGATGAIYAIRRKVFEPVPEDVVLDDVLIPMRGVLGGYRTVFDGMAKAWDVVSKNMAQEKRRKVRTLYGNYQLVQVMPELLSPWRNPIFIQFLSHKFMRLLVPFFFLLLMLSAVLTRDSRYAAFFVTASVVLLLPLLERYLKGVPIIGKVVSMSKTFTSLNWFAILAFLMFIRPGRKDVW